MPNDEFPDEETARTRRMASRLIVDIDQFERMLSRRGYSWRLTPSTQPDTLYSIQRAGDWSSIWVINAASILYESLLSVEEAFFDRHLGGGQHHMQCRTCQTPLLRAVEGRTTQFYVYRSLDVRGQPNGPSSPPIAACPGCAAALGIEQVIEIDDVVAEDEREREKERKRA